MRKRKLVPVERDGRAAYMLSHVPFTFNAGDIDWHCGTCNTLILSQTHDEQHYELLIECPRCHSCLHMPKVEEGVALTVADSQTNDKFRPAVETRSYRAPLFGVVQAAFVD